MNISKKLTNVIALPLLLGISTAWSQSPSDQVEFEPFNYVGVHAGPHDLRQWPVEVNLGNDIRLPGRLDLDAGFRYGALLGRQYKKYRYELEYQEGRFDINDINLGKRSQDVDDSGKYQVWTLNAYRTKELGQRVTGFIGAGIGWGHSRLPEMGFTNGCQCFPKADGSDFIWQLRAGLERQLSLRNHLGIQYTRLFRIPGPESGDQLPQAIYPRQEVGAWSLTFRRDFRRDDQS
ncbi:hypothetical protein E3V39_15075 [Gammaproteobacteria bacterium LSUCC0112]|nr:hypothetical protein E3V39_15075 [Gammaproteobacteria bacterium LSUCC0112]